MAESSLFWDGTTVGDALVAPYNADEFSEVLRAITGASMAPNQSGVFHDPGGSVSNLSASLGTNYVGLYPGRAQVFGTTYLNTPPGVVISTPSANATSRIDRFCLRKDWAAKTIRFTRIAGVEGVGPGSYIQNEGVLWDMPLFTVSINTAGITTLTSDDRIWLPYISELPSSLTSLPFVTSIPALVLSDYTKNLITVLNNLISVPSLVDIPNLNLSDATENLITLLNNLISAPSLTYAGLAGLTPPMVSLIGEGSTLAVPASETNHVLYPDPDPGAPLRIDTTNGSMWNASVPNRITCVQTGLYEVSATVGVQTHASLETDFVLRVAKNSALSSWIAMAQGFVPNITHFGSGFRYVTIAPTVVYLTSGDYIQLVCDHLGYPSPLFDLNRENFFTLKYIGAKTPSTIGNIF